jgi:two-component system NtrC family response regulator
MARLLLVEDDEGLCAQYRWAFPGHTLTIAGDRRQALAAARREQPAVALLDLGLPPDADGVAEGFATLEELQRAVPGIKPIVVTGSGERANALRAVAAGAYDFCEKPVELDVLRTVIDRALRLHALEAENRRLAALPARSPIERIVTADPGMLRTCQTVRRLAETSVSVLLLGESGTGKEALAEALHTLGPRARHEFVAINCGAIPENLLESELFGHERGAFTGAVRQSIGRIEQANHGTLFLDEIGDLPASLQAKLLRFLQDQVVQRIGGRGRIQVDVRVVSATNQPLQALVEEGRFRADLFYRLNPVTVRIPPLRERPGDAALLAGVFLERCNREFGRSLRGLSVGALAAIAAHAWPGNVRELENRVKRAAVLAEGRQIEATDLELERPSDTSRAPATGPAMGEDLDLRAARHRAEREVIEAALARSGGTLAQAAKLLGISRPTLYGLLAMHGMVAERTAEPAHERELGPASGSSE